jgi:hypothetical protein
MATPRTIAMAVRAVRSLRPSNPFSAKRVTLRRAGSAPRARRPSSSGRAPGR